MNEYIRRFWWQGHYWPLPVKLAQGVPGMAFTCLLLE